MDSQAEHLTTAEAAKYLRVSIPTLRRWTKAGLPVIKNGKRWRQYARADLDQWRADHKVGSSDSRRGPSPTPSDTGRRPSDDKSSLAQARAILAGLRRGPRSSTPRLSEDSVSRAGGVHA